MSLLIIFGTRPEFLKIKPLCEELKRRNLEYFTLFTSQHKDIDLGDFKISMRLPEPIGGNNRLGTLLSLTIFNICEMLHTNPNIKYILVQGDTTSALAGALAGMNSKVKVIHLEAGLRTRDFDNPYPEEYNRQIISRIASIHLCPTKQNRRNIIDENCDGIKYVVGNTIIDTLVEYKSKVKSTKKVLVTLHRRENHNIIDKWFEEINELANIYTDYEFILPLHPNPDVQKHKNILTDVNVIDPLTHEELLNLLVTCGIIISDSGGIQEECSFFNKNLIVCRNVTEREESIGINSFLCENPDELRELFIEVEKRAPIIDSICPYGDGTSSKQIVDIFEDKIYK